MRTGWHIAVAGVKGGAGPRGTPPRRLGGSGPVAYPRATWQASARRVQATGRADPPHARRPPHPPAPPRRRRTARRRRTQPPHAKNGKNGKNREEGKTPRTRGAKIRRVLLYMLVAGLVCVLVAGRRRSSTSTRPPSCPTRTPTSRPTRRSSTTATARTRSASTPSRTATRSPTRRCRRTSRTPSWRPRTAASGATTGSTTRASSVRSFNNASGNATQGASTITQQYIKILYLTPERSYTRKLKEAILSLKLGKEVSKQEILEGYLNTIYFGRGAYGIQAAAKAYFQKDAADLDLKETAALASIINNPTPLRPGQRQGLEEALRERYRYVLDGMANDDDITADEAEQAERSCRSSRRAGGEPVRRPEGPHAHHGEDELARHKDDRRAVHRGRDRRRRAAHHHDLHPAGDGRRRGGRRRRCGPRARSSATRTCTSAVASVQVDTGAIRGIYGGQDYLQSQINWAIAGGQAGSSMKPFALAAGIKAGYSLKDTFDGNSPFELPTAPRSERGRQRLRLGGQPDQGHRGLDQHGLHRPHRLDPGRPAGDHDDDERDGHPAGEAHAQVRLRLPRPHRGPRAVPEHHPGHRDGEPDQHGQRLLHHRQRRRGSTRRTSSRRS